MVVELGLKCFINLEIYQALNKNIRRAKIKGVSKSLLKLQKLTKSPTKRIKGLKKKLLKLGTQVISKKNSAHWKYRSLATKTTWDFTKVRTKMVKFCHHRSSDSRNCRISKCSKWLVPNELRNLNLSSLTLKIMIGPRKRKKLVKLRIINQKFRVKANHTIEKNLKMNINQLKEVQA